VTVVSPEKRLDNNFIGKNSRILDVHVSQTHQIVHDKEMAFFTYRPVLNPNNFALVYFL